MLAIIGLEIVAWLQEKATERRVIPDVLSLGATRSLTTSDVRSLRCAQGRAFVLRIEPGHEAGPSRPFGLQSSPASRL
nr:hypothetical protein pPsy0462a_00003 [Pseudomonas syringae]